MSKAVEFKPLFPNIAQLNLGTEVTNTLVSSLNLKIEDATYSYELGLEFLREVSGNKARFNPVRGWLNTLFNYCWFVEGISICDINRIEFRRFMEFTLSPPEHLISKAPYSMFDLSGENVNPNWCPFVNKDAPNEYKRTSGSVKAQLSILSTFFNFLFDEGYIDKNPAALYLARTNLNSNEKIHIPDEDKERSLSKLQWRTVWGIVCKKAENDVASYRVKFLFAMFYLLYLRVSELSARAGYEPTMNLFSQSKGYWTYYVPRSKYGRSRHVMCPVELIEMLKEYRLTLGLTELPTPNEMHPLFPRWTPAYHGRKKGELHATLGKERIQEIVKEVFAEAYNELVVDHPSEAEEMLSFSAHSLRHTGIVNDLDIGRSEKDIMLEAGHKDLATLSRYAKTNSVDRYESAKDKTVKS